MASPPRLTRQGVRDLDFGWKKKPVVVPDLEAAVALAPGPDLPPDPTVADAVPGAAPSAIPSAMPA